MNTLFPSPGEFLSGITTTLTQFCQGKQETATFDQVAEMLDGIKTRDRMIAWANIAFEERIPHRVEIRGIENPTLQLGYALIFNPRFIPRQSSGERIWSVASNALIVQWSPRTDFSITVGHTNYILNESDKNQWGISIPLIAEATPFMGQAPLVPVPHHIHGGSYFKHGIAFEETIKSAVDALIQIPFPYR